MFWGTKPIDVGCAVKGAQARAALLAGAGESTSSGGGEIISTVNCEVVPGMEYAVEIIVRGKSIMTHVDGKLMNQVADADYPRGGICLTAWHSKTKFQHPQLRIY